MNRNKLTPCRKVGLSRKKITSLKTVESLLSENKNENQVTNTPEILKNIPESKPFLKIEVNSDTPCRQVGLSRKRKTPTSLVSSQKEVNFCTPSRVEEKNNQEYNERNSNIGSSHMSVKEQNVGNEISNYSEQNNKTHLSCAKKLSSLFPSPSSAKDKLSIISDTDYDKESVEKNPKNSVCKLVKSKPFSENLSDIENGNSPSLISTESENIAVKTKKFVKQHSMKSAQKNLCDKNLSAEFISENSSQLSVEENISSRNNTQFIKVCYFNEKENPNKIRKQKSEEKETKLSTHLLEDDDFDIIPKKKKPNRLLERSKTEIIKKEKKSNKNKLKKSLSAGDSRSRTLTDSSIKNNTSTLDLQNNCFVKLEKLKESHDQSDDDFEVLSCTPKETRIKNLDTLEEEVKKKRQIVEELERAKLCKKMHSAEDLKKLTSIWKNGCIDALQDLLKQLNMHSYMDMEMLLKKLNIPQDFIPSS
ncbi:uncharacterized protein LOC123313633 [Coccinella septempunctata]|uniref:uncharacterized protein LOC123313633 n=1 Tax=Coccinella septempunctata TaxID=41139 RepID=UPI001D097CE0|nr:uncharacterized protein LOC123313633 [Coccinella septempunctata]